MHPSGFDEANGHLGPARGMGEDEVGTLRVWRGALDGFPTVVSCWRPTAGELAEIQRTGRVWLGVLGVSMPPVWISGEKPEGIDQDPNLNPGTAGQ